MQTQIGKLVHLLTYESRRGKENSTTLGAVR